MTEKEMVEFLSSENTGRLGLWIAADPYCYVVPVSYGYANGKIIIHGPSTSECTAADHLFLH